MARITRTRQARMAQRTIPQTTFSTSNYRGGRVGLTGASTGNRYVSRTTVYNQVRAAMGLSTS